MASTNKVFVSPGVYTSERDLQTNQANGFVCYTYRN